MKAFRGWLWATVSLAILTSFFVNFWRIKWEKSYTNVTLVADYGEIYNLAARQNYPLEALLTELKQRQIQALAFSPEEFSVESLKRLRDSGFELVLTLDDTRPDLNKLTELNPRMVILSGEDQLASLQVYKSTSSKGTLATCQLVDLLTCELILGVTEFSELRGIRDLYKRGFVNFVRVHTIDTDELEQMNISEALARWERAVTERNIRVLYLNFFDQPVESNLHHLDGLRGRLIGRGFRLGSLSAAPAFYLEQAPELSALSIALMLTGVLSFFVLTLNKVWKVSLALNFLLWLLAEVLLLVWGYFSSDDLSALKKLFAFGVAIVAPVSGYLFLAPYLEREQGGLKRGLLGLLGFCTFSIAGGLMMGAILSGREFFLKLDEFRGVKLALVLPLLLVFLLYCGRQGFAEFRRFLSKDLKWGDFLLLGAMGAILLLVVLRSENFSIPVLGVEQYIRGFLEDLFYARPRFKEFLLGHPALFLWGALGFAKLREYSIIVLILGMLGQVSIINTFAHLHTPLMLSLLRTANGIVLGLAIGLFLFYLFKWGERYFRTD